MNKFRGVTAHKDSGFVANIGHNGVAWRDDVQVVQVTKRKRYAPLPGVYVEITPFP